MTIKKKKSKHEHKANGENSILNLLFADSNTDEEEQEEIQIAKEIESGKRIGARAILCSSLMLREVINIGEKLSKGVLNIRDVTNTLDDESDVIGEEEILVKVKHAIDKIKRFYSSNERTRKKLYGAPRGKCDALR